MGYRCLVGCLVIALSGAPSPLGAQFRDDFDGTALDGWDYYTGDGSAAMTFTPHAGYARLAVDGSRDPHNVWWAIIKRDVAPFLDLAKLNNPAYELRVEARVRPSHAPRRVNFMLNTQRTTDYHEHLREYDLASTSEWQTISMTTRNFDGRPGDAVFVQLGVTDWGAGQYHVDIDYYRADVVRRDQAAPDLGEPLIYHPEVPDLTTFRHHLPATHDAVMVAAYPEVNFNDWSAEESAGKVPVLTVSTGHAVVLRWDFAALHQAKAAGAAVLELTTQSVMVGGNYVAHYGEDLGIEFGKIRIIEILGGDPEWEQADVTFRSLLAGGSEEDVFNSQMTYDLEVTRQPGGRNLVTLPRPVLQRLLDGRTQGLVIKPLGAITASFYASEDPQGRGPRLHFDVSE